MSLTVRQATADDLPWLLEQLAAFDRFFGSSRSLFPDAETAAAIVRSLIAEHPFIVAFVDGAPVGFIAGALHPHPYNPQLLVLSEMFWWVDPAHRGSRAGLVLLNAFVTIGRARADWIIMTLEADSPINPATLMRRGFRPKEVSYLMEVA